MTLLSNNKNKAVTYWMLLGVGMLIIQVVLGGVTRLTGSGLSITEWNVVTGTLPPLNNNQWLIEFNKYKTTPQFQLLNADFSLSSFKFIFFWEWFHRFWARLIGIVFIVGFVYLLIKNYFNKNIIKPLLILFLLGAMQGAIGWVMVKSGLTEDMIYVKPIKLALHFIFALVLICYAWWVALQLAVPTPQIILTSGKLRKITLVILFVLFFQLIYGALMAGHKAASAASTWPTINGSWVPPNLFSSFINIIENKITVHFIHRGLAYTLILLTLIWTWQARKICFKAVIFNKIKWMPFCILLLQVLLGMMAVLKSPFIVPNKWGIFEWIAQIHQIVGLLYLLIMVLMLYIIRPNSFSFNK